MKRSLIITTAAALGVLGSATNALAGTASLSGSNIGYTAPAGETNLLTVSQSATAIVFTDTGAAVTAGAGCTAMGANAASCAIPPNLNLVYASLGDGNDTATMADSVVGPSGSGFQLLGGAGNDTLTGGENIGDYLSGDDGNDTLNARAGNDGLSGGIGNDSEVGGLGNDTFGGEAGTDTIDGGPGRDTLTLRATPDGADTISLGADRDRLDARERTSPLVLTMDGVADDGEAGEGDNIGADVEDVEGGQAANRMVGTQTGAPTRMQGGPGNDSITGGPGTDSISSGAGNDTISSGEGTDQIFDGSGADTIATGAGDDEIDASFDDGSADVMSGGSGTDRVTFTERLTPIAVSLDDVANDGRAGENDNVAADVEDVVGTAFNDTLSGSSSSNQLDGGGGSDTLSGLGGSDSLTGGRGNDLLNGGLDTDTLDGGDGADRIASRDISADDVSCGGAVDTVLADRFDQLRACESVSTGTVIGTSRSRNIAGRVKVSITCPAAEEASCRGTVRLSQRRGIGSRAFIIPAGATKVVTVRLAMARRSARGRATATATFIDANGAVLTTTRRITIR